jgi:hypothetical protein
MVVRALDREDLFTYGRHERERERERAERDIEGELRAQ